MRNEQDFIFIIDIVGGTSNDQFTDHGKLLAKLPDFGSLAMSKSVYAALLHYNCGRDLIILSSILGVLNTTTIFKSIPQSMKSSDGDFMTLLNTIFTQTNNKKKNDLLCV